MYSPVGIDSETAVNIDVKQPAMVLITEDQAEGSLTDESSDAIQAARAIVYRMGN